MKKLLGWSSVFFLLIGCGQESANVKEPKLPEETLFELVDTLQSGVTFRNQLDEGLNTNVLVYEYFYNGGGVATADFNGDSLIDVYFVSNMGDNALYLNQGDWQFKEVAQQAGLLGRPGPWKTGVSHVDINADGLMDLYVCYSGALPAEKRKNQLFVNQGTDASGIPTFKEQAEAYGLASSAYSNQGFFFDYDLDGDLDMLLLNHNPKSIPVLTPANTRRLLGKDDPERGLRLLANVGGKFEDVTVVAGINGSSLSYGLGLGIEDMNDDGFPDFYVSNDYEIPDYLYINKGDGTFTDELKDRLEHVSKFSMGNNLADVNNDGAVDIFTLDMLPEDNRRQKLLLSPDNYNEFDEISRKGFHYQYMRNMLQLANGDGTYSEVGQLYNISNTDWSWSALLADYDNDGWKDLYVTNGYHRDYTNLDFIDYMDNYVQSVGRLKREDVMGLLAKMPSSNVKNYIFENEEGRGFRNRNIDWGVHQPSNSNGAAYADLDNDGDLDLVVNNINKPAFLYRNYSRERDSTSYLGMRLVGERGNTLGLGAVVEVRSGEQVQRLSQTPYSGYLSAVSPNLLVGLGSVREVDELRIEWPAGTTQTMRGVEANQTLVLREADALKEAPSATIETGIFQEISPVLAYEDTPANVRDYNRQPLLINELSFTGPCLEKGDVNGDGFEDLFIGGAKGESARLYLGSDAGLEAFAVRSFDVDRQRHDTDALFFDANGDQLMDIYVASGGYHDFASDDELLQDRLYINDGQGDFYKNTRALPEWNVSTGVVVARDFDEDGDIDLFVGGRVVPGAYPEVPGARVLMNDGRGRFEVVFEDFEALGLVTDAAWVDLENDGESDLVIAGHWMPVMVWAWRDGQFVSRTEELFGSSWNGWWNEVDLHDFNRDGTLDIVAGNIGLNCQIKATPSEPVEMYYADFDENGAIDPILCHYVQGESFPFATRKELLKQIVSLQSRFTSYASYAEASLEDIFDSRQVREANKLTVSHLSTSLFLSNGQGGYEIRELPLEAQYAPIHAIIIRDFDGDGQADMLLAGNNARTSLRLGRFDANRGQLYRNAGRGSFEYVPQTESGLSIPGDVREILTWGENQLLFGISGASLLAYEW